MFSSIFLSCMICTSIIKKAHIVNWSWVIIIQFLCREHIWRGGTQKKAQPEMHKKYFFLSCIFCIAAAAVFYSFSKYCRQQRLRGSIEWISELSLSIYFSNSAGGQSSLTSNSLSSQSTGSSSPGSTSVSFSSSFSLSFLSMLSLGFGTSSVIELPTFVSLSVVIFPIDSSQDSPFIVSLAGYFLCCQGFSAEILGVEF